MEVEEIFDKKFNKEISACRFNDCKRMLGLYFDQCQPDDVHETISNTVEMLFDHDMEAMLDRNEDGSPESFGIILKDGMLAHFSKKAEDRFHVYRCLATWYCDGTDEIREAIDSVFEALCGKNFNSMLLLSGYATGLQGIGALHNNQGDGMPMYISDTQSIGTSYNGNGYGYGYGYGSGDGDGYGYGYGSSSIGERYG